ncbi:MAG: A/G-specific adenine glycosylase [Acetobacteraceae bacterium]
MPWRAGPGETPDPYRVWLSEIMLQQTTVAAVIPYFERFLRRFPTVEALAAAPLDALMEAWAGLGYYARARNLHAAAQRLAAQGGFPRDLVGLRELPGVGAYTAAAIASIAFGTPVVPVDGNVERVAARVYAIAAALPQSRPIIAEAARQLGLDPAAQARPADFTQALFDLGATICTARSPACGLCPWRQHCAGHAVGLAPTLPRKAPKPVRPLRHGAHFWLQDKTGQVLLRRRAPTGLLGGMLELPGSAWRAEPWPRPEALQQAPQSAAWELAGQARHGFTHFELLIDVYAAIVPSITAPGLLRPSDALASEALPTVMRRCVRVAETSAARDFVAVFTSR